MPKSLIHPDIIYQPIVISYNYFLGFLVEADLYMYIDNIAPRTCMMIASFLCAVVVVDFTHANCITDTVAKRMTTY